MKLLHVFLVVWAMFAFSLANSGGKRPLENLDLDGRAFQQRRLLHLQASLSGTSTDGDRTTSSQAAMSLTSPTENGPWAQEEVASLPNRFAYEDDIPADAQGTSTPPSTSEAEQPNAPNLSSHDGDVHEDLTSEASSQTMLDDENADDEENDSNSIPFVLPRWNTEYSSTMAIPSSSSNAFAAGEIITYHEFFSPPPRSNESGPVDPSYVPPPDLTFITLNSSQGVNPTRLMLPLPIPLEDGDSAPSIGSPGLLFRESWDEQDVERKPLITYGVVDGNFFAILEPMEDDTGGDEDMGDEDTGEEE